MKIGRFFSSFLQIKTVFLIVILSLFSGTISRAQFRSNISTSVRLFSQKTDYYPGEELFIYVLFFRVPDMAFFSISQLFRNNRNFKLTGYEKVSGVVETGYDAMGFPEEFYTILYRLRVKPISDREQLSFGPFSFTIRMGFQQYTVTSNRLLFYRRGSLKQFKISTEFTKKPTPAKLGEKIYFHFKIKCPLSLCTISKFQTGPYQRFVEVKLPRSDQVLFDGDSLEISQDLRKKFIFLTIKVSAYPLREGQIEIPPIKVFLPIVRTLNQQKLIEQIYSWFTTQGISKGRAERLIKLTHPILEVRSVLSLVPSRGDRILSVLSGPLCRGNWDLSSRRVVNSDGTPLWWVQLSGEGLFSLSLRALKAAIRDSCGREGFCSRLKLIFYRWAFPNREVDRGAKIDFIFRLSGALDSIPPLKMRCRNGDRAYTLKTEPLSSRAPAAQLPFSIQVSKGDYRLYLSPRPPLSSVVDSDITVFLYAAEPSNIPFASLLSQVLKLRTPIEFERVQRFVQIVRTSRQQGAFGSMITTFSSSRPIWGYRAYMRGRKREGLFDLFPTVYWGGLKIAVRLVSSKGIFIRSRTDRREYFVGEPVNYTLEIFCPLDSCPDKSGVNYGEIFRKGLKLPKLEVYPGLKVLENFQRSHREGEWVIFRYRAQFPAPSVPKLSLAPAVMRLSSQRLLLLYRTRKICLFYSEGGNNSIEEAIAKDHFDSQGGSQCSFDSRQLSTSSIQLEIRALPPEARGIKLIGEFSISVRLSQLEYPLKKATTTDKPFFLSVELSGEGDLDTAVVLIRDQLRDFTARLQRIGAVSYIEKVERWKGGRRIRVQIIAERAGKIEIPPIKLRYFHRQEGVVTAESLPLSVSVEWRRGERGQVAKVSGKNASQGEEPPDTEEIRPILPFPAGGLKNDDFQLFRPLYLISFSLPIIFFLAFLGWLRYRRINELDPGRRERNRAFSDWKRAVARLRTFDKRAAETLEFETISYFIKRFSLKKRFLTVRELEEFLRSRFPELDSEVGTFIGMLQRLESAIYGGDKIDNWEGFIRDMEVFLKKFR